MVLVMSARGWHPTNSHSPSFGDGVAAEYAATKAVCVRPLVREVTDRLTGATQRVVIPCGSTLESSCKPCADKGALGAHAAVRGGVAHDGRRPALGRGRARSGE